MGASVDEGKKATEYLANERTFLAWMRTTISIISLGFVVAKFGVWLRELSSKLAPDADLSHTTASLNIGVGMMAFGGLLAIASAFHYRRVATAIRKGDVRSSDGIVLVTSLFVVALSVVMIVYMLSASQHL